MTNNIQEIEAYMEPLHHENTTLRGERDEWTNFITKLQADHDEIIAGTNISIIIIISYWYPDLGTNFLCWYHFIK